MTTLQIHQMLTVSFQAKSLVKAGHSMSLDLDIVRIAQVEAQLKILRYYSTPLQQELP